MKNLLNDEVLEQTAGGKITQQNTNFCPRCRNSSFTVIRMERGVEHRRCNVCQFEYDYRKW